ncbi:hypothetical protein G647_04454 [Cladophialophora carrionii CBS 160.54]|uniref:Uncharacterized protein n=1 Tax=Cladophialophora carrionii CBS 160.54 TaxID=1279043 RepID=V9DFH3_9EURO|nr:uncharacterized protein G647_04454 [Cladophialophora carrionii CBS 160.54]ETI25083.1 hypothetical protein G647_04454 [Cladophialophora carrionii CBS 160.54]
MALNPFPPVKPNEWSMRCFGGTAKAVPVIGKIPQVGGFTVKGRTTVEKERFKSPCKTIQFDGGPSSLFVATVFTAENSPTSLRQGTTSTRGEPWVTYSISVRQESSAPRVEDQRPKRDSLFDEELPPEDALPVQRRKQSGQTSTNTFNVSQKEQNEIKAELYEQMTGRKIALPRPGNAQAQAIFDREVDNAVQEQGGVGFLPTESSSANPGPSQPAPRPHGQIFDEPEERPQGGRPHGQFFDEPEERPRGGRPHGQFFDEPEAEEAQEGEEEEQPPSRRSSVFPPAGTLRARAPKPRSPRLSSGPPALP